MRKNRVSRPLLTVVIIEVAFVALVLVGSPLLGVLFPDMPGYSLSHVNRALVLLIVLAVALLALVASCGWWRLAGFTSQREWRDLRLYWLPVLLLAVPFIGGVDAVSRSAFVLMLVGYI